MRMRISSAEYLRSGLCEMNFWEEVVQRVTILRTAEEKLKFNAVQVTGAAVAQVYNDMIQEGHAPACLTNGYCKVFSMCPRITLKFFIISYRSPL
ncbi:hypothetical protein V1515DRAFT_612662 [Lipomyces mesembrius]